ncbi:hypothetical protein HanIR_Chr07g0319951 [Helianthus annuus]|nr:hypothetical protein HanIR_Chr07g0319951 [Helianthus annuus]
MAYTHLNTLGLLLPIELAFFFASFQDLLDNFTCYNLYICNHYN